MKLNIRTTDKSEYFPTENLTRETFWNLFQPGCTEHLILHQLRKSRSYIEALDLVALHEDEIVGHIISTKARIVDNKNNEYEVLSVGPFSVIPSLQNNGIGTELLNYSITRAKEMGYRGMILFGNPEYYHRFGFRNAKEYDITTKDGQHFDAFMALELSKNSLENVEGRFFKDEAFQVNEEILNEFEKQFPNKEKGKSKIDLSQQVE